MIIRILLLLLILSRCTISFAQVDGAFGSLAQLEKEKKYRQVDSISRWLLTQDLSDSLLFNTTWYQVRAKFALGEYNRAKVYLKRILPITRSSRGTDSLNYYNAGAVFMDLGRADYFLRQLDSARINMDSASRRYEQCKNWDFYAKSIFNQSIISRHMGDQVQGFALLMKAKKTLVQSSDWATLMILYAEISNTLSSMT